jgi:hypothetical protein
MQLKLSEREEGNIRLCATEPMLKMKVMGSSAPLIPIYQILGRHIQEDRNVEAVRLVELPLLSPRQPPLSLLVQLFLIALRHNTKCSATEVE